MSKLTRGEFFLNSRPFSESFLVSRKCQLVLAMTFAAVHAADLCWKVWSVRRADCRSGQPRRLRSCIRTVLPASPLASSLQQESCRRGRNQTLCSFFSLSRDTPAYAVNTFRSGLAHRRPVGRSLFSSPSHACQELSGGRVGSHRCAATIPSTAALLGTRSENWAHGATKRRKTGKNIEGKKKWLQAMWDAVKFPPLPSSRVRHFEVASRHAQLVLSRTARINLSVVPRTFLSSGLIFS